MTIDNNKVTALFNERASNLNGNNSVLSSNQEFNTVLQNRYRDYITRKHLLSLLKIKKSDVLLDFGCGIGRLSKLVAKKSKFVIGVDSSEQMISKAKALNSVTNISYLTIEKNLSFIQDESISKIYTCWVLQHVSDEALDNYLKEFYRILKVDGTVVILEQTSTKNNQFGRVIVQRKNSDYVSLFKQAGFQIVLSKKIFRVPSYAMHYWVKLNPSLFLLPIFKFIERLTISRKQYNADYFTEGFIFRKNK